MSIYHGKDLRKGRFSEIGRPYLITTVTQDRAPLFTDWHTGRLVINAFREIEINAYAKTYAWVVMPDHIHWLMAPMAGSVTDIVRRAKSCSARGVNRAIGRTGPVWQKGYHDHALHKDEDIKSIARYIVANPLRAGLVEQIGDYPLWDSIYIS